MMEVQKLHAPSQSKTQKVKKQLNQKQKDKLWAIYDADKPVDDVNTLDIMEQTEFCVKCHQLMIYSEEGFPTCPKPECGHMNNYSLDYSP